MTVDRYQPTTADIEASLDVVRDVAELSDSVPVETAVDYRAALVDLIELCRDTVALLDAHLVSTLESPIERGGWRYEVKPRKEHERFDHGRIASGVADRAAYDLTTGERLDIDDAIREAVHLMREVYLAPSSKAKVTVLDALGFARADVVERTWGGNEVRVSKAAPDERS